VLTESNSNVSSGKLSREALCRAVQIPCYSTKQEELRMTDLIQLSDAESAAVAGGIDQSISISYKTARATPPP